MSILPSWHSWKLKQHLIHVILAFKFNGFFNKLDIVIFSCKNVKCRYFRYLTNVNREFKGVEVLACTICPIKSHLLLKIVYVELCTLLCLITRQYFPSLLQHLKKKATDVVTYSLLQTCCMFYLLTENAIQEDCECGCHQGGVHEGPSHQV